MPSTRIETRTGWIGHRRQELIEAVQNALLEGLLIPRGDRCVRLPASEIDLGFKIDV